VDYPPEKLSYFYVLRFYYLLKTKKKNEYFCKMIKVTLIGAGNVAQHLISAFQSQSDIEIVQVFSRNTTIAIPDFDAQKMVHSYAELKEADVYLIAVSDDAIATVSEQLPFANRLVVHTSGAAPLESLSSKNRRGVFYPLQTFTKGKKVSFRSIPLCLEAISAPDFEILKRLAQSISESIHSINSEQRKALHVAAVFVNNFTNHLYAIGQNICAEHHVSFDVLKPLIIETANKIMDLSPSEAQTGPAKRNDFSTIQSHEAFLKNSNQNNLYKTLTQSIQNHGKEL